MIKVAESDQDVLRFLWVKDIHAQIPEIQTLKFTRVVFGVSPSPYILNATIAHHLEQFESTHGVTAQKIRESIYVDDFIMGARDIEEALTLYQEPKEIFKRGGFNLRKFMSNCKALQSMIDASVGHVTAVEESYAQTILGRQHRVWEMSIKFWVLSGIWSLMSLLLMLSQFIMKQCIWSQPSAM